MCSLLTDGRLSEQGGYHCSAYGHMIQTSWGEFGWAQCAVVVHSAVLLMGRCEQTDRLTHDWLFISLLQQQKAWEDPLCSAAPQYSLLWYLSHALSFPHPLFPFFSKSFVILLKCACIIFSLEIESLFILLPKFFLVFFCAFCISILFFFLSFSHAFLSQPSLPLCITFYLLCSFLSQWVFIPVSFLSPLSPPPVWAQCIVLRHFLLRCGPPQMNPK